MALKSDASAAAELMQSSRVISRSNWLKNTGIFVAISVPIITSNTDGEIDSL
jgi:hypothetical protein